MRNLLLAGATLIVLQSAPPAVAQGRGGMIYDRSNVTTVGGTLTRIDSTAPARAGALGGLHFQVTTTGRTYDVHAGPSWFLADKSLTLRVGDTVKVTGSLVTVRGEQFLLAATIERGDKRVAVRDSLGVPLWSRGRRGGGTD